ncbi:MAG: hypothetical protein AAB425_11625, partial [Bdellovibrionota bacterium]
MSYFTFVKSQGFVLQFVECSPAVTNTFSMLKSFSCGGEVLSVAAPFRCDSCDFDFGIVVPTTDITKLQQLLEPRVCGRCTKRAVFDEIAAEFFQFMTFESSKVISQPKSPSPEAKREVDEITEVELEEPKKVEKRVALPTVIDENTMFVKLIGQISGSLRVDGKLVSRINSVGVKAWIFYYQQLLSKKIDVWFTALSPALVEQVNNQRNFARTSRIESIYLPFDCPKCGLTANGLIKTVLLRRMLSSLPYPQCPKCKTVTMEFDDLPAEYFVFLSRKD